MKSVYELIRFIPSFLKKNEIFINNMHLKDERTIQANVIVFICEQFIIFRITCFQLTKEIKVKMFV